MPPHGQAGGSGAHQQHQHGSNLPPSPRNPPQPTSPPTGHGYVSGTGPSHWSVNPYFRTPPGTSSGARAWQQQHHQQHHQHLPQPHHRTPSNHHRPHSPAPPPPPPLQHSYSGGRPQLPNILDRPPSRTAAPTQHPPPPSSTQPHMSSAANSPSASDSQESRDEGPPRRKRKLDSNSATDQAGDVSVQSATGGSSSNRRQRVHFSCTECHRRKQKCNRQTPCQHCIARKVPERCKTFQPGQDENLDITARVTKLERTVEEGFDRILTMLQRTQEAAQAASALQNANDAAAAGTTATKATASRTVPATTTAVARRLDSTSSSRNPQDNRPKSESVAGESSESDEANDEPHINARGGFHGSGAGVAMRIDSLLSGVTGSAKNPAVSIPLPLRDSESGDLNSRMVEYGAADRLSDALMSSLPTKEICKELVDHYFNKINWLSQQLPERYLRPLLDSFLNPSEPSSYPPALTTTNINVFAAMMCLMSISALSVESEIFPSGARTRRIAARRYQWAGRRALLVSQVLGKDDLVQVIAFQLAWRFLMLDRRISEAWACSSAAVNAAFSIGLHRDGSKLGLDKKDTDLRRGIWWMVRFGDYILAMNLGRPPLSDPSGMFSDTDRPTLEGLQHWWPFEHPLHHPDAKPDAPFPNIYQHGRNRIELAKICGKIVEIYQQVKPHHYSDVLALDAEILKARAALPHYYQARVNEEGKVECDTSLDGVFPMLLLHRFLMYSEIFFIRITLHRPYLLRSGAKGAGGQRFVASRRACMESALEDMAMRDHFVCLLKKSLSPDKIPMTYYIHIGTYSWFNSLLVASMASIMDPTMSEIPKVRQHIDRFLTITDIKGTDARAMELKDEMREREAKIVQMFAAAIDKMQAAQQQKTTAAAQNITKRKGGGARGEGRDLNGSTASREEATADVLLGLGKSADNANVQQRHKPTGSGSGISGSGPHSQRHHRKTSTSTSAGTGTGTGAASPAQSSGALRSTLRGGDASSPDGGGGSSNNNFSLGVSTASGSTTAVQTTPPTHNSSSTVSGDSPNTHVVDAAQADLNAWFQREFVGGTLFDHSLNGLGLPDGSDPASSGLDVFGGQINQQQQHPSGASVAFPSEMDDKAQHPAFDGNLGRDGGVGTGTSINFGGMGPSGVVSNDMGVSASGATFGQQQQQQPYGAQQNQVQWSTLPQPAWGGVANDLPYGTASHSFYNNGNPGGVDGNMGGPPPFGNLGGGSGGGGGGMGGASNSGAGGGAGGPSSLDPNFWAELIDKITT